LLETFANSWLSRNSREVQTKRAGSIIPSYYKYFANSSTILFSSGFWRIVQLHKVRRYSRVAFKPKDIKRLYLHNLFNRPLLFRECFVDRKFFTKTKFSILHRAKL